MNFSNKTKVGVGNAADGEGGHFHPSIFRQLNLKGLVFAGCLALSSLSYAEDMTSHLHWSTLPNLPPSVGLAAAFGSVCDRGLLVAGGTNFPDKPLSEGGKKAWHDEVYLLDATSDVWRLAGKLPTPRAYGVGTFVGDTSYLIGGSDSSKCYADVLMARRQADGSVSFTPGPTLPHPLASMSGIQIKGTIYLVGGQSAPNAPEAGKELLALEAGGANWKMLPPLPGPGRLMPVVASDGENLYVFSGFATAAAGAPVSYLRDAYVYHPSSGWKKLADLPFPAAAAPSPAVLLTNGRFLVVGGVDGVGAELPPAQRPPVPRRLQIYDPLADSWEQGGEGPPGRVTVQTSIWNGKWVLPGGEIRAGIRTAETMALELR